MSFIAVSLTHETRVEEYLKEICRLNENIESRDQQILDYLKLISVILERQMPTGSDIQEVQQ